MYAKEDILVFALSIKQTYFKHANENPRGWSMYQRRHFIFGVHSYFADNFRVYNKSKEGHFYLPRVLQHPFKLHNANTDFFDIAFGLTRPGEFRLSVNQHEVRRHLVRGLIWLSFINFFANQTFAEVCENCYYCHDMTFPCFRKIVTLAGFKLHWFAFLLFVSGLFWFTMKFNKYF